MPTELQPLTPSQVTEIVRSFPNLKVWHAALSIGTMIRFELGGQVRGAPFRSETELRGTGSLGIWADEWLIEQESVAILHSENPDKSALENLVFELLRGEEIVAFEASDAEPVVKIVFSNGTSIAVHSLTGPDEDEEDLFQLHVPDGRIICFNRLHKFYLADEVDETLLLYWRNDKGPRQEPS